MLVSDTIPRLCLLILLPGAVTSYDRNIGQVPIHNIDIASVSSQSTFISPLTTTSPKHLSLESDHQDTLQLHIDVCDNCEHSQGANGHTINALNAADTEVSIGPKSMKATNATIGVLSTLIAYVSLNSLLHTLKPDLFIWQEEDKEASGWIQSSHSWIDRKICRWLDVCGAAHLQWVQQEFGPQYLLAAERNSTSSDDSTWEHAWSEGKVRPEDWTDDERVLRQIPDYVLEYAPLVHLFSGEHFWPSDLGEHLDHITSTLEYTPLPGDQQNLTLDNLGELNEWGNGRRVFLTSNDDPEDLPDWLRSEQNIPVTPEEDADDKQDEVEYYPGRTYLQGIKDAMKHLKEDLRDWFSVGDPLVHDSWDFKLSHLVDAVEDNEMRTAMYSLHTELKRSTPDHTPAEAGTNTDHDEDQEPQPPSYVAQPRGGRSPAPAVLVVVDKGAGVVDAFWFFFYSFNLGNVVLNVRFGNHVGDWEHTAVRFHNGTPKAVFVSEHEWGSAYSYPAVEKHGKRPIVYSATGTHAMYATPGLHPYVLPFGVLHDQTDRGPLWDPVLNMHSYTYDPHQDTLRASQLNPSSPTSWFHYRGHWGDKFYPLNDKRQYSIAGQYHYVNGPLGPKFKNLGRKKICGGPDSAPCVIKNWLSSAVPGGLDGGGKFGRRWRGNGRGDGAAEGEDGADANQWGWN